MKLSKNIIIIFFMICLVLFIAGCAEQQGDVNQTTNTTDTNGETPDVCTPEWSCTDWSECGQIGTQTRTCTDVNACDSDDPLSTIPTGMELQTCIYVEPVKIFDSAPNGFDYYNYVPHDEEIEKSTKLTDVHVLYEFPIMGSPMPYYIYNTTDVNQGYFDSTSRQIVSSIGSWKKAADKKVDFERVYSMPEYGILIELVNDDPGDNAVADIVQLDGYTLITGGTMQIQAGASSSERTYKIMHAIGHVFGFDHSSKQLNVMHTEYVPIAGGKQMITSGMNDALEKLYRDIPVSE